MIEIINFLAVGTAVLIGFVSLKVALDFVRRGSGRVREVREEGGGLVEKFRGELRGGQHRPSSARAHGLYISVEADGIVSCEPKSMIAHEVA